MANNFQYTISLTGNFPTAMDNMTKSTGKFTEAIDKAMVGITETCGKLAKLELASGYVERITTAAQSFGKAGVDLDSKMHDLSAIAGVVGDDLDKIEGYARKTAKAFGTDAGQAVESYKLLLSQLSPELGKYPEALQAMGRSIATTSKLMGGDGVAAASSSCVSTPFSPLCHPKAHKPSKSSPTSSRSAHSAVSPHRPRHSFPESTSYFP